MPSRRKSSACTDYVPAICTHRPSLLPIGCGIEFGGGCLLGGDPFRCAESKQYFSARGSKSRNKVAVGEPAAGSFTKVDSSIGKPACWSTEAGPINYVEVRKNNSILASNLDWSLLYRGTQVTTIALIGGCLGSGIDEDRS